MPEAHKRKHLQNIKNEMHVCIRVIEKYRTNAGRLDRVSVDMIERRLREMQGQLSAIISETE